MARYAVPFETMASTIVYVEAESAEEALELADDLPYICAQCSGWGSHEDNTGIELGEWEPSSVEPWVEEE